MLEEGGRPEPDGGRGAATDGRSSGRGGGVAARTSDTCRRCGGFTVGSFVNGIRGDLAGELLPVMRCVSCGDVVDALMRANRAAGVTKGTRESNRPE